MSATSQILELTVVASTAMSLLLVAFRACRLLRQAPRSSSGSIASRLLRHPWTWFVVTCAALLANQVLVGTYIEVVHGGDPGFVTRYFGRGWFALDPANALVRALADGMSRDTAERWLAPSILRVNAFLELPFTVAAYLSVAWLFDRAAYRFLLRSGLAALASVSFTIVFSAVEVALWNPWTRSDLVIRAAACVFTMAATFVLARLERSRPAHLDVCATRASSLALALVASAAIAALVLGMYDVTLLYNFGHARSLWPAMASTAAVATLGFAAISIFGEPRMAARLWAVRSMSTALTLFAVLFFLPSLAIRYRLSSATAQAAGVALVVVAAVWGLARCFLEARRAGEAVRWAAGLGAGLATGVGAAWTGLFGRLDSVAMPIVEARLLRDTLALVLPAFVVWLAADSLWARTTGIRSAASTRGDQA